MSRIGIRIYLIKHFRDNLYKNASLVNSYFIVHGERDIQRPFVVCNNKTKNLTIICTPHHIAIRYDAEMTVQIKTQNTYWYVGVWRTRMCNISNVSCRLYIYIDHIDVVEHTYTPNMSRISNVVLNSYRDLLKLIPILVEV